MFTKVIRAVELMLTSKRTFHIGNIVLCTMYYIIKGGVLRATLSPPPPLHLFRQIQAQSSLGRRSRFPLGTEIRFPLNHALKENHVLTSRFRFLVPIELCSTESVQVHYFSNTVFGTPKMELKTTNSNKPSQGSVFL